MHIWQLDTPLLFPKIVMPVDHGLSQHYIYSWGGKTSSMNYMKNSIPFLETSVTGIYREVSTCSIQVCQGINGNRWKKYNIPTLSESQKNPWIWMSSTSMPRKLIAAANQCACSWQSTLENCTKALNKGCCSSITNHRFFSLNIDY